MLNGYTSVERIADQFSWAVRVTEQEHLERLISPSEVRFFENSVRYRLANVSDSGPDRELWTRHLTVEVTGEGSALLVKLVPKTERGAELLRRVAKLDPMFV